MMKPTYIPIPSQSFPVAYPGWMTRSWQERRPALAVVVWIDRVSLGEARIFSNTRFNEGERVELRIRIPDDNRQLSGSAIVRWVEATRGSGPFGGMHWAMGLAMDTHEDARNMI